MKFFRKHKKHIAAFTILSIINQLAIPLVAVANNGGDVSAEYSKGGGVGSDLVNMYNGAFNYKVDLITLPGAGVSFPLNISYNSADVNMLSVPTCVGEGWSLNLPKITRTVKGVPDDFNGDVIRYDYDMKPSVAMSIDLSKAEKKEFWGLPNVGAESEEEENSEITTLIVGWDNYAGINYTVGRSLGGAAGADALDKYSNKKVKIEVLYHSRYGYSYRPSFNTGFFKGKNLMDKWWQKVLHYGLNSGGISLSGSTRQGFQGTTLSSGNFMNFSYSNSGIPLVDLPTITKTTNFDVKAISPFTAGEVDIPKTTSEAPKGWYRGTKTVTELSTKFELKKAGGLLYDNNSRDHWVKDFIGNKTALNKHMTQLPSSQVGKDVFIQSGGYGGVFTVDVNDHKVYGNTYASSNSDNSTILAEAGFEVSETGDINLEAGGGKLSNSATKTSGVWPGRDSEIKSTSLEGRRKLKASEVVIDDVKNVYDTWQKDAPVAPIIKKKGAWGTDKRRFVLRDKYVTDDEDGKLYKKMKKSLSSSVVDASAEDFKHHKDERKLKYVEYLTTTEALGYGFTKESDYIKNVVTGRENHIAEIIVFERDQSKLIYGEPVYTVNKVDASFSYDSRNETTENSDDKLGVNEYEGSLEAGKNLDANNNIKAGDVGQGILNKVTTSPYATSWLVQDIPSRDYEDVTRNGVSNDDKGDCVHFEYFSPHSDVSPIDPVTGDPVENYTDQVYNWRFPYENVDVMQGIKDYPRDNMASYTAGQNELKYTKSIETKTHHLEFVYDTNYDEYHPEILQTPGDFEDQLRKDGYPVKNLTEGGINNSGSLGKYEKTWRLREVRLYAKNPDGSKESNKQNFIQKVVLDQDYSLCESYPSNIEGRGKLTLKSVHSTYRQSLKGENYKYKFGYNENSVFDNPIFNRFNTDRWGTYQNNSQYGNNSYPFKDHPYTNQNGDEGINPAPWCLKRIELPSGADLSVDYERNEYSYSNDKIATEFLDILSTKQFDNINDKSKLDDASNRFTNYSNTETASIINRSRLIVKLDPDVFDGIHHTNTTELETRFLNTYLKDLTHVKVKAYVDLKFELTEKERSHDWVDVNAKLKTDDCKVHYHNGEYYGELRVEKEPPHDFISLHLNPIRKAAFEKLKQQRTDVYRGQPTQSISFDDLLVSYSLLISSGVVPLPGGSRLNNAIEAYRQTEALGPSNEFIIKGAAPHMRLNGWSKVALKTPELRKKGGGYRVKTITLSDNWTNSSDASKRTIDDNYKYILKYDYDAYNVKGDLLGSSGVANEPINGNMENADFELTNYIDKKGFLFEGDVKNVYGHAMDIHKGGPSIGYENVIVRTTFPDDGNFPVDLNEVKLSSPPYQEYKFYSQREYPTLIQETSVAYGKPYRFMVPISGFVELNYFEEAYSQGYSIVTNDMAGKLKSLITKDKNGNVINGQRYYYKSNKQFDSAPFGEELTSSNSLNNSVLLIDKGQKVEEGILGVSESIWTYASQNKNEIKYNHQQADISGGISFKPPFNITGFFLMPLIFLPVKHERDATKFAITNKVIHKSGILEKVETIKDESIIETRYLGYDKLTGKVLLSSVENEFGDHIYKFSHPGYWEYNDFNAVENSLDTKILSVKVNATGILEKVLTNGTTSRVITEQDDNIHDGDLVAIRVINAAGPHYKKAFVKATSNGFQLLPYDLNQPMLNMFFWDLRVIESGYANLVDASVGEVVGQVVNVKNGSSQLELNDVLNDFSLLNVTSKLEFNDSKLLNVSAVTFKEDWEVGCCTGLLNPYRNGMNNYWRPNESFVYHGKRDYGADIKNRSRNAGRLLNYEAFDWQGSYPKSGSPWVLSSLATFFDKNGNLLEQKDALGLHSSSGYGYGGSLVKFVVGNSRFNESGFDGFEDYDFYKCNTVEGFTFYYNPAVQAGVKFKLDSTQSHSGEKSLKLESGESVDLEVKMDECPK